MKSNVIRGLFKKSVDQSSPQIAVEGFKSALIQKDWRRTFVYLNPKSQANLIGGLLITAAYASDGDPVATPKLAKIMQRHGIRKHETLNIEKANLVNIARDLMKWSDKFLPSDKKLDLVENAAQTTYSEYRIKDDTAFVIATCKGRRSEFRLKCIDGRWYFI